MQSELRFHWDKLESYMLAAIDKSASDGTAVSDAIKSAIPDMIAALRGVIVSTDASPTQRMRACEILFSSWSRCLRADLREQRAEVSTQKWRAKQAAALAQRTTAKAQDKKSQLEISKERKRIQRQLTNAEQAFQTPEKEIQQ